MTGREIVILYFQRHATGTLSQIGNSQHQPWNVRSRVGCALHDMKIREEIKLNGNTYEMEGEVNVFDLKSKPENIKCASYTPKKHFGGNNYLTQLLKAVR